MSILPVVALLMIVFFSNSSVDSAHTTPPSPEKKATRRIQSPNLKDTSVRSHHSTLEKPSEFSDRILKDDTDSESKSLDLITTIEDSLGVSRNLVFDVQSLNESEEVKRILNFIKGVYTRVSDQDAREIAKALVHFGKENGVDPKFAAALIARESAFNRHAISVTGAKGLGQIKNFNFKSLAIKDPFDVSQNVKGTVTYIKEMLGNWQGKEDQLSLALGSYFQGIGTIKRGNGQLDQKAKGYVRDILNTYKQLLESK